MFDVTVRDEILQLARSDGRWLSTGWNGGFSTADAAYNITVPEGWDRTDLDAYVDERLQAAGFETPGPALLTGVEMRHARGARLGPVAAYATAGISNPAALPVGQSAGIKQSDEVEVSGKIEQRGEVETGEQPDPGGENTSPVDGGRHSDDHGFGTVNLLVGTDRRLSSAARANLLTVVAEAKAATLLSVAGVPGTTTDAVIVGDDETGSEVTFSGSATPVGSAARACVRDALLASLEARYSDTAMPTSVDDAEYGVRTDRHTEVFRP